MNEQAPSKELTPQQEARAREIREDCRVMPGWASREIVRLQDRVAEMERAAHEPLVDRQREPDAVEKQALYANLRKLYRRDVPDETLDHSKPECPNTHAGKHIPGESYKVCWYCQL